jgi:hypothetical protein
MHPVKSDHFRPAREIGRGCEAETREITLRTKEINKTTLVCIHYVYRSGGGGEQVIPNFNGNDLKNDLKKLQM